MPSTTDFIKFKEVHILHTLQTLFDHAMYKDGLLVDHANIIAILDMVEPTSVHDLHVTLGHIGYYRWFIQNYAKIVAPLNKLFHKDTKYDWAP
jgi:hypothetical protein